MDNSASQTKIVIDRDRSGLYGLHVSNIPPNINSVDLRDLFHTSGFIKVCKIIRISEKDRVAFVKFQTHEEAVFALNKTDGLEVDDHILEVRPAFESKKKYKSSDSVERHARRLSNGSASNDSTEENSRKTEQKDELDSQHKTYNTPIYSSEDVRFSMTNGSSNSSESINELKSPIRPSANSKSSPSKPLDNPRHSSNGHSFAGPKTPEPTRQNSHPLSMNVSGKENSVSMVTNNLERMHFDDTKRSSTNQHQHARSYNHSTPNSNINITPRINHLVTKWSVNDVAAYYKRQEDCSTAMVEFIKEQEIDGDALMLIEERSLLHFMKLGPAVKFLRIRDNLKN